MEVQLEITPALMRLRRNPKAAVSSSARHLHLYRICMFCKYKPQAQQSFCDNTNCGRHWFLDGHCTTIMYNLIVHVACFDANKVSLSWSTFSSTFTPIGGPLCPPMLVLCACMPVAGYSAKAGFVTPQLQCCGPQIEHLALEVIASSKILLKRRSVYFQVCGIMCCNIVHLWYASHYVKHFCAIILLQLQACM